jgi:alkanesulfonate monooxygenase SsuD/methylene tetrahydromethanopterin reductase-like flavin-dependent oxidoreductase (luciferase family)
VEQFDLAARHVRSEDIRDTVLVSADPTRHIEALRELAALGFDELYLHHVGREQQAFIDTFGERVLPELRE